VGKKWEQSEERKKVTFFGAKFPFVVFNSAPFQRFLAASLESTT
jgi:hypothetical protein